MDIVKVVTRIGKVAMMKSAAVSGNGPPNGTRFFSPPTKKPFSCENTSWIIDAMSVM